MIEETLDLKRFADRSVAGLFEDDEDEILDDDGDDGNNEQSAWHDAEDDKIAAVRAEKHLAAGRQEQGLRRVDLEDAIRNGFRRGIGSRENAPAEWIGKSMGGVPGRHADGSAKHLDAVMRKGQGTGTEAEFNALLDEIIALIGFTPDKDVFKAFYSTQLAKRLLLNKSASDDMERNMTIKLQKG
jgi:cullin-4